MAMNQSRLRPASRYSLQTVLLLMAACAVALSLYLQQRKLHQARRALARYEDSQVTTALGQSDFRVIERVVLDSSHVKIVEYLIESNDERYATLASVDGGDSGSSRSRFDERTGLHTNRATVLLDKISSPSRLKLMTRIGGAHGYSLSEKSDGFTLDGAFRPLSGSGVFRIGAKVELFEADGRVYTLNLK